MASNEAATGTAAGGEPGAPDPAEHDGLRRSGLLSRLSSPVMGFNPFRSHERDFADIVMVVGALVLTIIVVLWALWG